MDQLLTQSRQIAQILKARRRALGITQTTLAPKLGITQNRLSQLEADPNGFSLDKLIELLNLLSLDLVIQDRKPRPSSEW